MDLVRYVLNSLLKPRLFEHFWTRNGTRVGEEGAFGWSTLLEAEENWWRVVNAVALLNGEEGGWTGWPEPLAKNKIGDRNPDCETNVNMEVEDIQPEWEDEDTNVDDDNEVLPRKQGIDIDSQTKSYQEIIVISGWLYVQNLEPESCVLMLKLMYTFWEL